MRKLLYDLLAMQKCILHVTHKLAGYYLSMNKIESSINVQPGWHEGHIRKPL